ncbi:MAG: hypothetical protein QXY05_03755 [Candidatus Anstonellales archaeon]
MPSQKKTISSEEFKKNHPEIKGWHITETGTRIIAFKFDKPNHVIIDRIEKRGKEWYDLGRITGNISWYAGYDKNYSLSTFFAGLSSACETVQAHIKKGTLTIGNPLSKRLDKLMLAAIVIEELIPIKTDVDGMIDIAYVLFTSDLTKIRSSDRLGSVGVFQTLPGTHDLIKQKYPSFEIPIFKKCDTYEEQAVVAILLAYENLALFNTRIFSKYETLQTVWSSSSEEEQRKFTAFVVAAMHNAPSSTLNAFESALNVLASGNFTLGSLMKDVANELNLTTKSSVKTGNYATRVVYLYNRMNERGFSNFTIYQEDGFAEGIKGLVYKKAK